MKARIPTSPLRFGTENDFNLALNELRWIKEVNGEIRGTDFESVSLKYSFPKDFLKHGLNGLSQEDYILKKSKWFPIIYSWWKHIDSMQTDYLKRIIWYSRSMSVLYFWMVGIVVGYIYLFSAYFWLNLNLVTMLTISVSMVLFGIPFLYHLNGRKVELEEKVAEQENEIRKEGMDQMIESVNEFLTTSKILHVAVISPKKAIKFVNKNIKKLTLTDLGEIEIIKGGEITKMRVAYAENPDEAHIKRWKELLSSKKTST